ncbi:hypothetical protein GZ78_05835 [Endozoicomonas numazuensis]|uniref:Uncharacterized protein n=1 Tax=Endozoicomonas numazuensis TaxID=1137799 RepID=A0A081NLY3_9GAMM|nr:hypothetical protein GZ78_05835 [Endozoicomonas numazuensis]
MIGDYQNWNQRQTCWCCYDGGEQSKVRDEMIVKGKSKLARLLCSDLLSKVYLSENCDHLGDECCRLFTKKNTGSVVYQSEQEKLAGKVRSKLISTIEKVQIAAEKEPCKKVSVASKPAVLT